MIDQGDNFNEEDAGDTIESVGIKAVSYNNIVDRYFTKYYIDKGTDKEQYVFIHTNGIIMCGLGENNFLVKSKIKIKEIKDLNKVSKVSGKRKHGAHVLMENEYILQFICEENENVLDPKSENKLVQFNFSPKVKGKLLEINSNIFNTLDIVQKYPEKYGFLCFLLLSDNKAVEALREKLERMNNINK